MNIKIVFPDNADKPTRPIAGNYTRFFTEDGTEIKDVMSCVVDIRPDSIVTATLAIAVNPEEIEAHALLDIETVREAAKAYGYRLEPQGYEG